MEGKPARVHSGSANWMCLSPGVSLETALHQAFASGKCGNVWNVLRTVYKLELDFIDQLNPVSCDNLFLCSASCQRDRGVVLAYLCMNRSVIKYLK